MPTIITFNGADSLHRVEVDEPMNQVVSELVAGWARVTHKGQDMAINPANVAYVVDRPKRR
jgi:hypothetical protein